MRLLALYTNRTLSLLRRVQAPFSVLAQRGYPFSFMQVPAFDIGHALGYDVTLLPNWVLSDEEVDTLHEHARHKGVVFAYDLSDLALLQQETVLRTLHACCLITVPNAYTQREVQIAAPGVRVEVLPSTVDIPYILTGNAAPMLTERPAIGCFGPYDWSLVKEALVELHAQKPRLPILGDAEAVRVIGTDVVQQVELVIDRYPLLLHQCLFGLCPMESDRGQDRVFEHEYGLLCIPVLRGNASKKKEEWVNRMQKHLRQADLRAARGQQAHEEAKEHSAVRLADQYLRAYRQSLPHLAASRYTGW